MNNFHRCSICGEYGWDSHKCNPKWYVWPTWEDFVNVFESKYHIVFARDAEKAAISYAENDWEFPDNEDVWVVSVDEVYKLSDKYDDDQDEEFYGSIMKIAEKYSLNSELVRHFMAEKV